MRVLVLFSMAVAAVAAAQPLSFSRTEIPAGPSCCSMVTGDFNGDGQPDLAVIFANSLGTGGSHLLVLMGKGDGRFTFRNIVDLGRPFLLVAAVDVNGNKKPDIIITAPFSRGPTVPLFGLLLTAADVNGDGKSDLVSESEIALGNGDGTFQSPQAFGYGQRSIGSNTLELSRLRQYPPLVAADFDQDGKLDLAMPSHLTVIFGAGNSGSGYIASALSILLNNSPGSPRSVTAVSAANGAGVVAPGSIASIYGTNLAPGTTAPGSFANLPTNLGGISLHVRDSFGADRLARLFYVSPTQVNFLVPDATAEGLATINIDDGHLPFVEGLRATVVQMLAPSFFTADGTGTGAAAAAAVRVLPSGTQISVPAFTCSDGRCNTVPINVSQEPVYLTLYGTGFRHRSASQNGAPSAGCNIQNWFASVIYAGPQGPIPGLDQLSLLLPQKPGAGETDVVCTFSFYTQALSETALSPPVKINIE